MAPGTSHYQQSPLLGQVPQQMTETITLLFCEGPLISAFLCQIYYLSAALRFLFYSNQSEVKCREVEMNESCCKNSRVQAVVAGVRLPGDGSQQEMVQDIVI